MESRTGTGCGLCARETMETQHSMTAAIRDNRRMIRAISREGLVRPSRPGMQGSDVGLAVSSVIQAHLPAGMSTGELAAPLGGPIRCHSVSWLFPRVTGCLRLPGPGPNQRMFSEDGAAWRRASGHSRFYELSGCEYCSASECVVKASPVRVPELAIT